MHRAVAGQDDAGGAGALGRAQERPEVAGIRDAVDRDQERGPPARARRGQIVEQRLVEGGRLGQHALRRLAPGLGEELAPAHLAHRHPLGLGQLEDVIEHVGLVLLGEDPDLPHLSAAREQELAHGLPAFHLVATETVTGA